MDDIVDAHYFMTRTQGNVYSLVPLNLTSGVSLFIAASWKRSIYSFGYCGNPEGSMKPTVKEHSFTYIPSGAEIISIDAFNKSSTCDDFHIGIAITKMGGDHPEMYMNIYSEQDLDTNYTLNIDSIAQNCFMLDLKFFPYHLTHTAVHQPNSSIQKETVWLLSGSDSKIHVFQEELQTHSWSETDVSELFPELVDPPSTVLWINVRHTHNLTRRVTVIGCDVGFTQVSIVNTLSNTVLQKLSEIFESPVTHVQIFSMAPDSVNPPRGFTVEDSYCEGSIEKISNSQDSDLHLLVCNGNNRSCVFMNIEDKGLSESNKIELDGSDSHDACVCSCVCDLDMDGENEILIGTFGSALLVYKWIGKEWVERGVRNTAAPVHGLQFLDLVGDGSSQLIVQTSAGVHIMQHKAKHMFQVLLSRLQPSEPTISPD
ncbi:KICSTOR complex protein kaptin-like [Macrosteles quadrilineatus]|uniref:KICSTOR complex protein kaptin-like n=1 Tax=Macrosteles quadrilineatus TaxID=74068 RepID=UPI0023E2DDB6|nr:KICSTOR complex protein kaptin-like [Macrosteles quadrilineatus]XP_054280589.1 KICSTOR complex protein kaptin-like [Macrosteles quadrilineatus]